MMRRKWFAVFAAMLIASVGITAQAQIVIGNFEGLANNTANPEGWSGTNGVTTASFNGQPAATLGTGAMSVVFPPLVAPNTNHYQWAVTLSNSGRPTLGADLVSHPILKLDISWISAQWPDATPADPNDNWAKFERVSINDTTGWQEVPLLGTGDPANPAFPGSWSLGGYPAVHTRTLTLDTRLENNNPATPMVINTAGFVQLNMAFNLSGSAFPNGGRFWIDNVRLEAVPEPASFAMLAFASLLPLMGRRSRS